MASANARSGISGSKELQQILKKTPPLVFAKAIVPASRRAMTPVAKSAKKNITALRLRGSGLLRKSIGVKSKAYRRQGNIWVGVGPRTGFRKSVTLKDGSVALRNPVKYAHLIEQGFRHRGGAAIPERAFLKSAMLAHQKTVERSLAAELGTQIPKIAAKLGKK